MRPMATDRADRAATYNYERFHPKLLWTETAKTFRDVLTPGEPAPDFELLSTDGTRIRLSKFRGTPVVLEFASLT